MFTKHLLTKFLLQGYNQLIDNFITFDNGQISINNSPSSLTGFYADRIQISQEVGDFEDGRSLRLNFNYIVSTGKVSVYYFNANGKGFRAGLNEDQYITGNGYYDKLHVIGEEERHPDELLNTLVIYSSQNSPTTNAILDNFILRQEFILAEKSTISFNESVRGWTSFKSFIPEQGVSLSSNYFTMKNGGLYQHHNKQRNLITGDLLVGKNTFYGTHEPSTITTILNESPSSIKSFTTLNYEGSQSKVYAGNPNALMPNGTTRNTLNTHNLADVDGWSVEYLKTDKQEGTVKEFLEKEGKWFNYIKGAYQTSDGNTLDVDTSSLSFQGLGVVA
jgi:hypothetical protein